MLLYTLQLVQLKTLHGLLFLWCLNWSLLLCIVIWLEFALTKARDTTKFTTCWDGKLWFVRYNLQTQLLWKKVVEFIAQVDLLFFSLVAKIYVLWFCFMGLCCFVLPTRNIYLSFNELSLVSRGLDCKSCIHLGKIIQILVLWQWR